jgi:hypothetical protein
MGAYTFYNDVDNKYHKTIEDAFRETVAYAKWRYGHGGYSGTIAEKASFVIRNNGEPVPEGRALSFCKEDGKSNDKWGPAYAVTLCVSESDPTIVGWMFYGRASS